MNKDMNQYQTHAFPFPFPALGISLDLTDNNSLDMPLSSHNGQFPTFRHVHHLPFYTIVDLTRELLVFWSTPPALGPEKM